MANIAAQLKAIYADPQRLKDFKSGQRQALRAAAEFVNSWDGDNCPHRLGDLLLSKFNQTNRKPRLSRRKKRTMEEMPF